MKRYFSVKHKLTIIVMFISSLAVVSTCIGFIFYDIYSTKQATLKELGLLANIVGKRTAPTLQFLGTESKRKALENLNDLKYKHSIILACIYKDKSLLSSYIQKNISDTCPLSPPPFKEMIGNKHLSVHQQINIPGHKNIYLGSIYLLSDMKEIHKHLQSFTIGIVILFFSTLVLIFFFTQQVQKIISLPILNLRNLANKISKNHDYSVRVDWQANDEIGELAIAFNHMIQTINQRNNELKEVNYKLEETNFTLEDKVKEIEHYATILAQKNDEIETKNQLLQANQQELEEKNIEINEKNAELEKKNARLEIALNKENLFISKMSHEIRTPLHQLMATLSMLLPCDDDMTNEDLIELLDIAYRSSARIHRILEDTLDFRKSTEDKLCLMISQQKLSDIILGVYEVMQPLMEHKQLKFIYHFPSPEPLITCSFVKIERLFINLFDNAVKYSTQGTISLTLEEKPLITLSGQAELGILITIKDEGCGIPEDELTTIFEPLKESSRTERDEKGFGMGLAFCQEIVKAHRGTITAQNNPQKGSTFLVHLPLYQTEDGLYFKQAPFQDKEESLTRSLTQAKTSFNLLITLTLKLAS